MFCVFTMCSLTCSVLYFANSFAQSLRFDTIWFATSSDNYRVCLYHLFCLKERTGSRSDYGYSCDGYR